MQMMYEVEAELRLRTLLIDLDAHVAAGRVLDGLRTVRDGIAQVADALRKARKAKARKKPRQNRRSRAAETPWAVEVPGEAQRYIDPRRRVLAAPEAAPRG